MHRPVALVAVVSLVCASAACSDQVHVHSSGLYLGPAHSPPASIVDGRGPEAAWAPDGRLFIRSGGSPDCPEVPTSVQAIGRHQVSVELNSRASYGATCSAVALERVLVIRIPRHIDLHAGLTVEVDNDVTRLAAR